MQTILGATGQIGIELARELHDTFGQRLRLVSRSPARLHEDDELVAADLLDEDQTRRAVDGSSVVYLTAGLPMATDLWVRQWPTLMRNVVRACQKSGCKLTFFDNTYMYPQTAELQTEETVFAPLGAKGRVRAEIARMLLDEIAAERIEAVICRAPEFYGPGRTQSITNATVLTPILSGTKPKVFLRDDVKRTLIFTPDASRAMALIGNTPAAYGQTWHLPCDDDRLTYRQLIELAAAIVGRRIDYQIVKRWQLRLAALVNREIKDAMELLPRYACDNLFVSDKFKRAFPRFDVTGYESGLGAALDDR